MFFCFLFIVVSQNFVEAVIVKYTDDSGVVHYTDDQQEAEESGYDYDEYDDDANPSPDNVELFLEGDELYVNNYFVSEITVKIHVSNKNLVEGTVPFDKPIEIEGKGQNIFIGTINFSGDTEEEVKISTTFDIGTMYKGSNDVYYSLNPSDLLVPFVGKFKVTQGWQGKFTHNGPKSRYAMDVSMPIGTPIIAVKDGTIVDMKIDSDKGGNNVKYRPFANFIRVKHDDGTMSIYVHLSCRSNRLNVGDRVRKGEVLALSGNTGYTTGPHLHFAMQTNTEQGLQGIKYKLNGIEPKTGIYLSNTN